MRATCWVSNLLQYTLEWFQTLDRVVCLNFNSLGLQWQEHLALDIEVSMPAYQERLSSLGDTTTLGPEWLQRGREGLEFRLVLRVRIVAHDGQHEIEHVPDNHFWCAYPKRLYSEVRFSSSAFGQRFPAMPFCP